MPSSRSSVASAHSAQAGWVQHALRKKYRDPVKLRDTLDAMCGEGHYQVIVSAKPVAKHPPFPSYDGRGGGLIFGQIRKGRWIVNVARQLTPVSTPSSTVAWVCMFMV